MPTPKLEPEPERLPSTGVNLSFVFQGEGKGSWTGRDSVLFPWKGTQVMSALEGALRVRSCGIAGVTHEFLSVVGRACLRQEGPPSFPESLATQLGAVLGQTPLHRGKSWSVCFARFVLRAKTGNKDLGCRFCFGVGRLTGLVDCWETLKDMREMVKRRIT